MSKKSEKIDRFRDHIQRSYVNAEHHSGDFGEILCFELHNQPINPNMHRKTCNDGFQTGLTFRDPAEKWGISCKFLGELIADHCEKLGD